MVDLLIFNHFHPIPAKKVEVAIDLCYRYLAAELAVRHARRNYFVAILMPMVTSPRVALRVTVLLAEEGVLKV